MVDFLSSVLPLRERPAGYQRALQHYFSYLSPHARIQLQVEEPELFRASIERLAIGQLLGAAHRCSSPHQLGVPRSGQRTLDLYVVHAGCISFCGPDGSMSLQSGDIGLWPTGTEWQAAAGPFHMIAFGLPGALVHAQALDSRRAVGRKIPGASALAGCLRALLCKAAECHRELGREEGAIVERAILDAVCLLGSLEEAPEAGRISQEEASKLDRLKALALGSLECPELGPAWLAEQAGVSTRTVHRLFATSGVTFQDWLRGRRLERCWLELTASAAHARTIAAVAFSCGFNDLSTFNRAFRARYGMTPRLARQNAISGAA